MTNTPKVIAWDFDGVLNRNIIDKRLIWADNFEADIGQSREVFADHVFRQNLTAILTGQVDLRDCVTDWAQTVGYTEGADTVLAYWLAKDALPDPYTTGLMQKLSDHNIRQIITTNNEARRARYIAEDMGFGSRVEKIFASGIIGIAKPAAAYFQHVTDTLDIAPNEIMLIDDSAANVDQANQLGWHTMHFTDETRDGLEARLPLA